MGAAFYLKEAVSLPPEARIVRAGDYALVVEAREALRLAREDARRIGEEAKLAYDAEKQRGYDDGLRQGQREIAGRMLETVSRSVEFLASFEQQMSEVVMYALQKILGDMDKSDVVIRLVHQALGLMRDQKRLTLRVARSQHAGVMARRERLLADFPQVAFLDVLADPAVPEDGCILESDIGVVETSLDSQLAAIEASLKKIFGTANPPASAP